VPATFGHFVWQYPAVVDRVIDGDTVVMHVDLSATMELHGVHVRVEGINAIELSQKFGGEARDYAVSLLPPGTTVLLSSSRTDKYGRFLATITMPGARDFGTLMLAKKASDGVTPLAIPYAG
jgi:endonuclease YncB( thermonuclease family)